MGFYMGSLIAVVCLAVSQLLISFFLYRFMGTTRENEDKFLQIHRWSVATDTRLKALETRPRLVHSRKGK